MCECVCENECECECENECECECENECECECENMWLSKSVAMYDGDGVNMSLCDNAHFLLYYKCATL